MRQLWFIASTCLFCSCALAAQNNPHPVRNIVLVHGAWADGSGWKGVYDILVKDGYAVSIVQEPETSFQEMPRNGSSRSRTDRAFSWLTAMAER